MSTMHPDDRYLERSSQSEPEVAEALIQGFQDIIETSDIDNREKARRCALLMFEEIAVLSSASLDYWHGIEQSLLNQQK